MASVVNSILRYQSKVAEDRTRKALCSHVARLLREERLRQELSLKVLAERAGLSRQMVSYVEHEERNPTLDTLLRLTAVLGVKLETFIAQARQAATKAK